MNRFRNDDHIALEQEAQSCLCGSLSVFSADFCQYRICKHIFAAFCKRSPGFNLAAVFFQIFFCDFLLLEYMCFDLVYSRFYFCKMLDIKVTVRSEVGYTDRTDLAFFVKFLHCTIGSIVITKWLMDQQKIQIFSLQFFHGFFDRSFCFLIAGICDPYLGCQEKLFSWQTAFTECCSYTFFVIISLCGVDAAISYLNRIQYAAFCIFRRCMINTISKFRHFDSVVQSNIFHDLYLQLLKCDFSFHLLQLYNF